MSTPLSLHAALSSPGYIHGPRVAKSPTHVGYASHLAALQNKTLDQWFEEARTAVHGTIEDPICLNPMDGRVAPELRGEPERLVLANIAAINGVPIGGTYLRHGLNVARIPAPELDILALKTRTAATEERDVRARANHEDHFHQWREATCRGASDEDARARYGGSPEAELHAMTLRLPKAERAQGRSCLWYVVLAECEPRRPAFAQQAAQHDAGINALVAELRASNERMTNTIAALVADRKADKR